MTKNRISKAILRANLNGNACRAVGSGLTRKESIAICRQVRLATEARWSDKRIQKEIITPFTRGREAHGPQDPIYRVSRRSEQLALVPLMGDPKQAAKRMSLAGRTVFEPFVAAFIALQHHARQAEQRLYQVTVQFNPEQIARLALKAKPAAYLGKRWRDRGLLSRFILVLEPGGVNGSHDPRGLHLHMVTSLAPSSVQPLRRALKRYAQNYCSAIQIVDRYRQTRLYDDFMAEDEALFGPLPVGAPAYDERWGSTYRDTGARRFLVHTELPIDLGMLDYMSKGITDNRQRGRRFTIVGLSGHRAIREALHREAQKLNR
ncbi:hypothetical protein [Ferrimonas balearica]|uniref:hypothetical protein n=1 Tax=Ferrimonas balearica TaxID=44012 RepID=UPI001C995071|nr:hypothetical protein [Ferrimonas balearica]MBY5990499.1 hypothetical protein [Ferrimonas balearica]